jgi:hypothetical protein
MEATVNNLEEQRRMEEERKNQPSTAIKASEIGKEEFMKMHPPKEDSSYEKKEIPKMPERDFPEFQD